MERIKMDNNKVLVELKETILGVTSMDVLIKETLSNKSKLFTQIDKVIYDLNGEIMWDSLATMILKLHDDVSEMTGRVNVDIEVVFSDNEDKELDLMRDIYNYINKGGDLTSLDNLKNKINTVGGLITVGGENINEIFKII